MEELFSAFSEILSSFLHSKYSFVLVLPFLLSAIHLVISTFVNAIKGDSFNDNITYLKEDDEPKYKIKRIYISEKERLKYSNCPNCNAPMDSNVCSYCGSKF